MKGRSRTRTVGELKEALRDVPDDMPLCGVVHDYDVGVDYAHVSIRPVRFVKGEPYAVWWSKERLVDDIRDMVIISGNDLDGDGR